MKLIVVVCLTLVVCAAAMPKGRQKRIPVKDTKSDGVTTPLETLKKFTKVVSKDELMAFIKDAGTMVKDVKDLIVTTLADFGVAPPPHTSFEKDGSLSSLSSGDSLETKDTTKTTKRELKTLEDFKPFLPVLHEMHHKVLELMKKAKTIVVRSFIVGIGKEQLCPFTPAVDSTTTKRALTDTDAELLLCVFHNMNEMLLTVENTFHDILLKKLGSDKKSPLLCDKVAKTVESFADGTVDLTLLKDAVHTDLFCLKGQFEHLSKFVAIEKTDTPTDTNTPEDLDLEIVRFELVKGFTMFKMASSAVKETFLPLMHLVDPTEFEKLHGKHKKPVDTDKTPDDLKLDTTKLVERALRQLMKY